VVGYLGDGINDAPSLKAADVGISVSNAVDVARDSADFILMHKNLDDLIEGIVVGRKTFANTLKYLMMALSSNFGNMVSIAGASLLLPFLPMLPVQILLNNLLYDSSQFAIPLDMVDSDSLKKPHQLDITALKHVMWVFGLTSSVYDFITFGVLYWGFHFTRDTFQTGWFLESLVTQTLVVYIIRTKKVPFITSAPGAFLLITTLVTLALGLVIIFSPLASIFKFTRLDWPSLVAISLIVTGYLMSVEVVKFFFYRRFTDSLTL
jgi:Mg2+-importing ATPase